MRRRRWKSKHAEAQPRNFANHGSRTDGWAPQEGVGQGVKPRRMLLCAFGGDGGAMELFFGEHAGRGEGRGCKTALAMGRHSLRGQLLSSPISLRML